MNRLYFYFFLILTLSTASCTSSEPDLKFAPTDVLVKTKGYFTVDKVFEFINEFDHDVEYVNYGIYNSSLSSDSLQYVLNYINAKPYTHSGNMWFTTGYLHYQTQIITVFPKLFQIKDRAHQADWLRTMEELKLTEKTDEEVSGYVIYFHVPEGQEQEWETKFEKYDFVEWAELNHIAQINSWP